MNDTWKLRRNDVDREMWELYSVAGPKKAYFLGAMHIDTISSDLATYLLSQNKEFVILKVSVDE